MGQRTRLAIKVRELSPHLIEPPNEIFEPLFQRIAKRMRRDGWTGRPLLVVCSPKGKFHGLTGAHRIMAARQAELPRIPVYVFNWRSYRGWRWWPNVFPGETVTRRKPDRWWSNTELLDWLYESGPKAAITLIEAEIRANAEPSLRKANNVTVAIKAERRTRNRRSARASKPGSECSAR